MKYVINYRAFRQAAVPSKSRLGRQKCLAAVLKPISLYLTLG